MTTKNTRQQLQAVMREALPVLQTVAPYAGEPLHLRPASASAGLFWVNGQYLFKWVEGDVERSKFLSPASVRAAFSHDPVDSGWLSPHMVRCGTCPKGDFEMMFIPAGRRQFNFTRNEAMASQSCELPMPGFFMAGVGPAYVIFAAPDPVFSPGMPLFCAPLPNVSGSNGSICWGYKQPERAGGGNCYKAWEIFLETPFSNHSLNGKSMAYPDDIRKALAAYEALDRYPLDDLIAVNWTPEKVLQQITEQRT